MPSYTWLAESLLSSSEIEGIYNQNAVHPRQAAKGQAAGLQQLALLGCSGPQIAPVAAFFPGGSVEFSPLVCRNGHRPSRRSNSYSSGCMPALPH